MTTTHKDTAVHDALGVLVTLTEHVRRAEEQVTEAARIVADRAQSVHRSVSETGYGLNSLGELQGNGPSLDVACGRLEMAVEVFRQTFHYLGHYTTDNIDLGVADQDLLQWFTRSVERSPRLTREFTRLQAQEARP